MADKNSNQKKTDKIISDLLKKLRPEQHSRACELIAHLVECMGKQPGALGKLVNAILEDDKAHVSSGSNSGAVSRTSPQPGPSTGRAPMHFNPGPTIYANSSDEEDQELVEKKYDPNLSNEPAKPKKSRVEEAKRIYTSSDDEEEEEEDKDQQDQVEKKHDPNQLDEPEKTKKSRVEEAKRQKHLRIVDTTDDDGEEEEDKDNRCFRDVKPTIIDLSPSSSSSDNDDDDEDNYSAPRRSRSLKSIHYTPTPNRTTKLVPIRVPASEGVQKRLFRINTPQVRRAIKKKTPIHAIPPPRTITKMQKKSYQPGKNWTKKSPKANKRKFPCGICSKTFSSNYNKKRHEKEQHRGSKLYKCTHCGLLFTIKRNLMAHYRVTHLKNPTPYDCPFCQKRYFVPTSLNKHILANHPRQTKPKKGESDSDTDSE